MVCSRCALGNLMFGVQKLCDVYLTALGAAQEIPGSHISDTGVGSRLSWRLAWALCPLHASLERHENGAS